MTETLPTPSGKQSLESHDGQPIALAPIPLPKIDLRDAHAIRRELGSVYRDMRARRIDTQDGTRMAYVLDRILRAYEASVLQDRMERLERTIDYRSH